MCSKLTIKTLEQHHWRRSGIFIVNFEHISHLVLVFLLLTLNIQLSAGPNVMKEYNHCTEAKNVLFNNKLRASRNQIEFPFGQLKSSVSPLS